MAEKIYFEGEIESATEVARNDGKRLLEINGYCAEGYSSLLEEVIEFFPNFNIEKDKNYLIVDDDDLENKADL